MFNYCIRIGRGMKQINGNADFLALQICERDNPILLEINDVEEFFICHLHNRYGIVKVTKKTIRKGKWLAFQYN